MRFRWKVLRIVICAGEGATKYIYTQKFAFKNVWILYNFLCDARCVCSKEVEEILCFILFACKHKNVFIYSCRMCNAKISEFNSRGRHRKENTGEALYILALVLLNRKYCARSHSAHFFRNFYENLYFFLHIHIFQSGAFSIFTYIEDACGVSVFFLEIFVQFHIILCEGCFCELVRCWVKKNIIGINYLTRILWE